MEKKAAIEKFKKDHPIRDCLGSGGGRYKWRRVLDCIAFRYGHASRKAAEMDRAGAARDAAAMEEYQLSADICPKCGGDTIKKWVDATGVCSPCVDAYNAKKR